MQQRNDGASKTRGRCDPKRGDPQEQQIQSTELQLHTNTQRYRWALFKLIYTILYIGIYIYFLYGSFACRRNKCTLSDTPAELRWNSFDLVRAQQQRSVTWKVVSSFVRFSRESVACRRSWNRPSEPSFGSTSSTKLDPSFLPAVSRPHRQARKASNKAVTSASVRWESFNIIIAAAVATLPCCHETSISIPAIPLLLL
mmetsp:Transcript_9415/g.26020  ORF Transcript_9415/g.26020 Transcript_9415/m.26020 type:complete len:199 (+) Transcript_9415:1968-2564(+)